MLVSRGEWFGPVDPTIRPPTIFILIILCHTLSDDERRTIAAFVRPQSPFTPIMAVSPLDAQRFDYAEFDRGQRPRPQAQRHQRRQAG